MQFSLNKPISLNTVKSIWQPYFANSHGRYVSIRNRYLNVPHHLTGHDEILLSNIQTWDSMSGALKVLSPGWKAIGMVLAVEAEN